MVYLFADFTQKFFGYSGMMPPYTAVLFVFFQGIFRRKYDTALWPVK